MISRHIAVLTIVLASTGALLTTATHHEHISPPVHSVSVASIGNPHHEPDTSDTLAIGDMVHHAASHLGESMTAVPQSYGVSANWKPSWELRWMDFQRGDHVVRVYHTMARDHSGRRFVIAVDDSDSDHHEHWTEAN